MKKVPSKVRYFGEMRTFSLIALHTIQKCKKIAGQNTFQILVLNDANMRTLGNKNGNAVWMLEGVRGAILKYRAPSIL